MNKQEIRENISCPQFGDNKYGKWGALRLEQRKCIYDLLNEIESADVVIKTLYKRIDKAIEYLKSKECYKKWEIDGDEVQKTIINILQGSDKE